MHVRIPVHVKGHLLDMWLLVLPKLQMQAQQAALGAPFLSK